MRVVVILVKSAPEERPHDAGTFNSAEWQLEGANHELIVFVAQRDVPGGEGVVLLSIELKSCRLGFSELKVPWRREHSHIWGW